MAALWEADLDDYSRVAVPMILARFPEWEPLARSEGPEDLFAGGEGQHIGDQQPRRHCVGDRDPVDIAPLQFREEVLPVHGLRAFDAFC